MTAILVVSDVAAERARLSGVIGIGPFVTIERIEQDDDATEALDLGHPVTCSADGGTCVRWGLDDTDRSLSDLIGDAETHVGNHMAGKS